MSSYSLALPDSITTWEIQVVTLSAATGNSTPSHRCVSKNLTLEHFKLKNNIIGLPLGFCVVEPSELRAFKNVFVSLRLPYSVRRYEQLALSPVIYNYGERNLQVNMT